MPEYSYRCDTCGYTFSVVAPMAQAASPVPCKCGETATRAYNSSFNIGGNSPGREEASAPTPEQKANMTFVDCSVEDCGTGFDVGGGISVDAHRMKMRRVKRPVRNRGAKIRFTDPDISA